MAIPESQAIQIAHADAANYYPDLDTAYAVGPPYGSGTPYTSYDSGLNRWTVRFDLLDPDLDGGGPSYQIHGDTGSILSKLLAQ